MADPVTPSPTAPAAPAAPAASAPVQSPAPAAPVAAPETSAPAAQTSEPPVQKTPEAAPKAASGDAAPVADKTVLETPPPKPAEAKPAEAKPADTAPEAKAPDGAEPKKEEGSQSAEPAQLPSYEPPVLPEGILFEKIDKEKLGALDKFFGEFENLTKTDHTKVTELRQNLINQHITEVQDTVQRVVEYYTNASNKMKTEWKDAFEKDPEIGGAKREATISNVVNGLAQFGGKDCVWESAEKPSEFAKIMGETGMGNHPVLIRVVNNLVNEINRLKTTYESEQGVKPLPGTKPEGAKLNKIEKRYGSNA